MLKLLKSEIAHRISGGFVVGALAILALQPPESALPVLATLKTVAGLA